jgi:hypothetical protein
MVVSISKTTLLSEFSNLDRLEMSKKLIMSAFLPFLVYMADSTVVQTTAMRDTEALEVNRQSK